MLNWDKQPLIDELYRKIDFLRLTEAKKIESVFNDFVRENNLSGKEKSYLRAVLNISKTFEEALDKFNKHFNTSYSLPITASLVADTNGRTLAKVRDQNKEAEDEALNKETKRLAEELGLEVETEYMPEELDPFIQEHGDRQTKFIWNLIKGVVSKLKIPTILALEGEQGVSVDAGGFYSGGKIKVKASTVRLPSRLAHHLVHELVHGATRYITSAVQSKNKSVTKQCSKKTFNSFKANTIR